ncbi:MAG: hypothetical protein EZS28_018743 [Streblomastix strix]|uniref:Uncharacterized protein n=1 Tax=Streblomastix strix TaxID=222440 RepID=A0A5J4VT06_9EUKA|nr:MAG: hypothetical protein EZS28_018743 [Streblomastix strix]
MTACVQGYATTEVLRFWLGFSTACGPFNQFAICNVIMKFWDTSIHAREQAVISGNSLTKDARFPVRFKSCMAKKTHALSNLHLAYQMIPPEKPDIIYLQNTIFATYTVSIYGNYSDRIDIMSDSVAANATAPQNAISQIYTDSFIKLEIQNKPSKYYVIFEHQDHVHDFRHVLISDVFFFLFNFTTLIWSSASST